MRRILMQATLRVGLAGLVLFVVPMTVILIVGRHMHLQQDEMSGIRPAEQPPIVLVAVAAVLALAALGVGLWAADRQAKSLVEPLQRLTEQAERLGSGDARHQRIRSGIEEIDRVSDVLANSAQQLLTSLSSERDFASDASHQLRTPLTALLMRLEEISLTDDLKVAQDEANIAIDQVERLNATVDALLARSRTHAPVDPAAPTSLDSVLARLQKEWMPAFEKAQRSVRVTGERGLQLVTTPVALAQILSTLIENSLVHGRGLVRIEGRRSGPSVVIEVSDQGPGVSPELAPHIFERSVSTKSTGLGLGLARDLAESHGGRLELVQGYPVVFALFLSAADSGDPGARPEMPG